MPTVSPSFDYSTGTISIADGENVVVGSGLGATGWGGSIARRGDYIVLDYGGANEKQTVIVNPIAVDQIEIPTYSGPDLVDVPYIIYWISPTRVAGSEAVEDITRLVNYLTSSGIFVYVNPADTVPDPSLGEEGQQALQPNTGKVWTRTGGVWVFEGVFRGLFPRGEYDAGTTYNIGDIVGDSVIGSSYISRVDDNLGNDPSTSPDEWMLNSAGLPGPSGASIFVQTAAPLTTYALNSLWIDSDSTDLDVYQLDAVPAWVDTGMNLKGLPGATIITQAAAPATTFPPNSLWIDSDSTDLDVYTLTAGVWVDTGINLKGLTGADSTVPGPVGPQGQGIDPDATGTLSDRATHDGAAAGFVFLRTDVIPMLIYVKNSATSGDWSAGSPVGGDVIAANNLSDIPDKAAARNNLGILDPIVAAIIFGG